MTPRIAPASCVSLEHRPRPGLKLNNSQSETIEFPGFGSTRASRCTASSPLHSMSLATVTGRDRPTGADTQSQTGTEDVTDRAGKEAHDAEACVEHGVGSVGQCDVLGSTGAETRDGREHAD